MAAASDSSPFFQLVRGLLGVDSALLSQLICMLIKKLEPMLRQYRVYDVVTELVNRILSFPLGRMEEGEPLRND